MIEIYTDGSCEPNPGTGGWAYVAIKNSEVISYRMGFELETTNNRMEYVAAISALEDFTGHDKVLICSDSDLLVQTVNVWMYRWESAGWKKPLKNRDLVLRLFELQSECRRVFKWVRGHNGNVFNEAADELAGHARRFKKCDAQRDLSIFFNEGIDL